MLFFAPFANSVGAPYRDRQDAGRRLASALKEKLREARPVVVGLPRGGVPVAYEVASALEAPLDIVLVRKLGAPIQPELAIGAIGEEGVRILDEELSRGVGVGREQLEGIIATEQAELERRQHLYREGRPPVPVSGCTAILVDDGIATGASAIAAARVLRARGAKRVVLAVPVGPPDVGERFAGEVDEVLCLEAPRGFFAVGAYYEHFEQTSDGEVAELLRRAHEARPAEPEA